MNTSVLALSANLASTSTSIPNTNSINISAPNAILIDMDSGKMLFEKDAYTPVYPASTTKVLTAILVLENCSLDEKVTASYEAINSVYANGTIASLQEGEVHTVKDLLSTMLIHSANDAAYVLAEHVGGSTSSFASMMNTRAKELGATSTYFVNPNGLPEASHKCSAYDMAIFANYAMKNFPIFREIVAKTSFTLPITSEYTEAFIKQNPSSSVIKRYLSKTTNHLINPEKKDYYYEYATGIKTGYTDSAKNCIVASAEKNDVELIVVIFGANGWSNLREDCVSLFEYGFSRLQSKTLVTAGNIVDTKHVNNATTETSSLDIIAENTIKVTFSSTDYIEAFSPTITINKLKAPINSGDVVGTISYNIYDRIYKTNLIAANSVDKKTTIISKTTNIFLIIIKAILWIVVILISLFILLVLLRAYIITKRQRYSSRRRAIYNARFRRYK